MEMTDKTFNVRSAASSFGEKMHPIIKCIAIILAPAAITPASACPLMTTSGYQIAWFAEMR
jgi:hypothetical protein